MSVQDDLESSAASAGMGTRPDDDLPQRPAKPGGRRRPLFYVRRSWYQLTSMRTALLLLFLLALAAVPGALLPQRGLNQLKVDDFFKNHPAEARWLDKAGLFDVFTAPWFAAVYLLLFVSLLGCVIPRSWQHAKALRTRPPAAPANLSRLPMSDGYEAEGEPAELAAETARRLRRQRWRTVVREEEGGAVAVAAEKGYLKETGNLVFHLSLVLLLAGLAIGSLFGYKGSVIVVEDHGFCNTVMQFDQYKSGAAVADNALPPFCVHLRDFKASYDTAGTPVKYQAQLTYGSHNTPYDLRVNHPLRYKGDRLYLLGHGYAPTITVKTPTGQTFTQSVPFLQQDARFTSDGVVKLPDALPKQIGIEGVFTPTSLDDGLGLVSLSAKPLAPGLSLVVYEGDLGLDAGVPKSVFTIDKSLIDSGQLKMMKREFLRIGEHLTLPDGTTVSFDGYKEWVNLQVSHDPTQQYVLLAAVLIVLGLIATLTGRRRRIWVRFAPFDSASKKRGTVVRVGGLTRNDPESFATEFDRTVTMVKGLKGS
jgi:cytochrome c biogenesis protein